MIKAGAIFENPQLGIRATIIKTQVETNNTGFQAEYVMNPKSGQDLPAHYHLWWEERFEVVAGTCTYLLENVQHTAKAGDTVIFSAKKSHIHPWNTGDSTLHMIQTDVFEHPSADAVIDTLNTIATQYGLGRDGKLGKDGKAAPLQLAVMMQILLKHGGYLAGAPPVAQQILFGILGSIGSAMGYKASYPQYTGD